MDMKKRLVALGAVVVLGAALLTGCKADKDSGQNEAQQDTPAPVVEQQQEPPAEPTAIVYEDEATIKIQPQDGQAEAAPDAADIVEDTE